MSDDDWGSAIMDDGTVVPLSPPKVGIPEEERKYLYKSSGLTIWTRKDEQ